MRARPPVYKDALGEVTVEHMSNLSEDEAREVGLGVTSG
jgi:hypothetical protein